MPSSAGSFVNNSVGRRRGRSGAAAVSVRGHSDASSSSDCSSSSSASSSRTPSPPRSLSVETRGGQQSRCCDGPGSPRSLAVSSMAELGVDCCWDDGDHFYMHVYKVMMCPKKFSHEWSACPFAHKGERATRRDPRLVAYSAAACPDFKGGPCPRGDSCPQSHGVFEACLHPERYKTQLCNSGTNCRRSVCFFAHALPELRTPVCQPVSPEVSPSPAAATVSSPVHQLLGVPSTQAQDSMQMRLDPNASSQNEVLMAQLLQFQQAFASLSSCLAMPGLQGQLPPHVAASLMAQAAQMQPAHSFAQSMADQWSCGPAVPSSNELAHDFGAKMAVSELSPRTPLDMPDRCSPVSPEDNTWHVPSYGKPMGSYNLFPEDLYPESNLPAGLFDGY